MNADFSPSQPRCDRLYSPRENRKLLAINGENKSVRQQETALTIARMSVCHHIFNPSWPTLLRPSIVRGSASDGVFSAHCHANTLSRACRHAPDGWPPRRAAMTRGGTPPPVFFQTNIWLRFAWEEQGGTCTPFSINKTNNSVLRPAGRSGGDPLPFSAVRMGTLRGDRGQDVATSLQQS
jgi:hypothetical protein